MQKPISVIFNAFIFTVVLLIIFVAGPSGFGQIPQDLPQPDKSEPLVLDSPAQIITFIVVPLLFIILYIWLRNRKKKR
jgi:uncharacterized BrkB/YihY/UPF0761 family membrane protein